MDKSTIKTRLNRDDLKTLHLLIQSWDSARRGAEFGVKYERHRMVAVRLTRMDADERAIVELCQKLSKQYNESLL